ncbi:MAG: 2-amino-4-hydroxy-6-hydroxymethyldihydropteridine diphosphokinase [Azonexus sp.]
MSLAYIALGANLGDPAATLEAAFAALGELPASRLLRRSSLYRTAPIGLTAQPDFINAAAALATDQPPSALLDALQAIERAFGRRREIHNGPRTLDLDLLLYDARQIATPRLSVPHPRLHLRAFVLQPLSEIAPDLALPGRGSVAAWLPAVASQRIARL